MQISAKPRRPQPLPSNTPVRPNEPPHPSALAQASVDARSALHRAAQQPATIVPFSPLNPASPLSSIFGSLILEIVARLEPLGTILKRYNISKREFAQLRATQAFQSAVREQQRTFSSLANTPDRVRMKAQLLTERLLDDMFTVAAHPSMPPSARVSAFSQIKNLTGLEKPENSQPAQKFSLTINLTGNKTIHVDGEAPQAAQTAKPLHRPTTNAYNADRDILDSNDPFDDEPYDDITDEGLDLVPSGQSLLPVPPSRPWKMPSQRQWGGDPKTEEDE